jgi:3-phenylpropionate/trans-cinnamate dioxygenase ferredoxin subunit
MPKYVIGKAGEVPVGSRKAVTVAGRDIVVFNIDGEYFGLVDRCPHRGAKLSEGMLVGRIESRGFGDYCLSAPGTMVRCPWHGWEYDLRTGRSFCDPDTVRARGYEIESVPGQTVIEGPFRADVLTIERAEDYLVVDLPR